MILPSSNGDMVAHALAAEHETPMSQTSSARTAAGLAPAVMTLLFAAAGNKATMAGILMAKV